MIIKIEQTNANLKNKFEIKVNNELKYLAGTPWMNLNLPLDIENTRRCIMTTIDENICYTTSYNIIENISNTAIPMKWMFTGEQKSNIFNIYDNKNDICGKFYKLTNGFLDTKYVIECNDYSLKSYDISIGKTRNISIYKDELQIAEIVKPLYTVDNLDSYYIFLLDQYSELEKIISFFTIFFDYQNYSNSGQLVYKKKEVKIRYSYNKNNKFYDKDWIIKNFRNEDVNDIYREIEETRKETIKSIKKTTKYILLLIALIWLVILIIFGIIYYNFIM